MINMSLCYLHQKHPVFVKLVCANAIFDYCGGFCMAAIYHILPHIVLVNMVKRFCLIVCQWADSIR